MTREAALTTWLTNTDVIIHPLVTNEAVTALHFAVNKARQLPWRMTIPWRQRHTGDVNSVAYSPDGSRIVSGSEDETVRVWDAETGQELIQLTGHTGSVWSVAYSPDGSQIVSGSEDHTIRLWYADIDYLLDLADSLIQRDPPIFVGDERIRFGFDEQPAREH